MPEAGAKILIVSGESAASGAVQVPNVTDTLLITIEGRGELVEATISFQDDTVPSGVVLYEAKFVTDGDGGAEVVVSNRDLTQSHNATTGRSSKGEFWQVALVESVIKVRIPVKFERKIELYAFHSVGAIVRCSAVMFVNLERNP